MPYYTLPQTYSHTYNKSNNYSHTRDWGDKRFWGGGQYAQHNNKHWNNGNWRQHFKGHHPQWWVNKWYPKWKFVNYRWHNNCWWVYIRYGNHYRTVCISKNFNWHHHWDGYRW